MNEIRDLIIGIDFGPEHSQITYYDRKEGEPQSVPEKVGSGVLEIPTVLCSRSDRYGFCIGLEAIYFASEKEGILIRDLYRICESEEEVPVGDVMVRPFKLLAEFLICILRLLGAADVVRNTKCLAITSPQLSAVQVRNFSMACDEIGLLREEYFLMDYSQSFFYYAMTQRRENWNRNIGWYDFRKDEVIFFRLSVQGGTGPVSVRLKRSGEETLPQEGAVRDSAFTRFVKETLSSELYSTIFITGDGFSQEWAVRSIKVLCQQQRRVFFGNNLFAKGACAGAKERLEDHNLKGYRFLSDSMVLTNVGMEMQVMGAPAYHPLIEAGKSWYEYHVQCEMILDEAEQLVFVVSKAGETEKTRAVMELPGLPERPPRTTRLKLEMEYVSASECVIRVRDMGFGELFPSSGRTWEETVDFSRPSGTA